MKQPHQQDTQSHNDDHRAATSMRPSGVAAKRSCPAGDHCDVLALLHGPRRVACRLVMVLLSQQRLDPTTIAELLGCDAWTVRRWIHRYNPQGTAGLTRPAPIRPARLGSPRLIVAGVRQTISQLPSGAVVLAEDETHLNLLPWVCATWIPTGTRHRP